MFSPSERKPIESERRQATILFADISGFTSMSEKLDPEEVTSIINSCFSMMGQIVEKHGGTIDKFIGDCIMVVFGVPVAIENAPKSAINTAIEMRNMLYQFNDEKSMQFELDIHIGINTGEVISGDVGSEKKREYTVMGDVVNLASRLRDASEKGQILVGETTYRYTRDIFKYRELGNIELKGKEKRVQVFELLAQKESKNHKRLGTNRMIFSEIVGRQKELDRLRLHVLEVINGKGSIVNVIGEAGIGKSRLIAELREKEEMSQVTVVEGRALSVGKTLPFHPIIDILRNWAQIREEDSDFEAIDKLENAVRLIAGDETAEIFPFVATIMGMKLFGDYAERVKGIEGDALAKMIAKNIRDLLVKASEQRPIIFILEDFHWADLSTIDLLIYLYRLVQKSRIIFINVFRPGYVETGEKLLNVLKDKYGSNYVNIYLLPLNEAQTDTLIENLLKVKSFPPHMRGQIMDRSEGNPFFIEEVIRSFIDSGLVKPEKGGFTLTDSIESVVIPHNINEVIMARIDMLEDDIKKILRIASVIGRSFFYKILASVADSVKGLDKKIEYLKAIQLICEMKRMEEIEYIFKHALTQEAIYQSILLQKRKELHLYVAKAIESAFENRLSEFYGMLAYHYTKGEELFKAEEYLIKAGELSLKSSASSEALHYYSQALHLYVKKFKKELDHDRMAMLEKNIAVAYYNKGFHVEAIVHFDKALEYMGEKRKKNILSILLNTAVAGLLFLKFLYLPSKRKKRAPTERENEMFRLMVLRILSVAFVDSKRLIYDSFHTIKKSLGCNIFEVKNGISFFIMASQMFSATGLSFNISRKILDYAMPYIDKKDLRLLFSYESSLFKLNMLCGNWVGEYNRSLVEANLQYGNVDEIVWYIDFYGLLANQRGDFSFVRSLSDKIAEIAEIYDSQSAMLFSHILNAELLINMQSYDDALKEVNSAIDIALSLKGFGPILVYTYGMKAYITILKKEYNRAKSILTQMEEWVRKEKFIQPNYIHHYLISQFLVNIQALKNSLKSKDRRDVAYCKKKCRQSAKKIIWVSKKWAGARTGAYRLMGIYYWLVNKQKRAFTWLNKSLREGERLIDKVELSKSYMEVGKRLRMKESRYRMLNGIDQEKYLKKAEELLREMDLQDGLRELKRIKRT